MPIPPIQTVIRNCKAIELRLKECNDLFQTNAVILAKLADEKLALNDKAPTTLSTLNIDPTQRGILAALSSLDSVGVREVPRHWLGVITGISPRSSLYRMSLAKLLVNGALLKVRTGWVSLTNGANTADIYPVDLGVIQNRITKLFKRQDADLLHTLIERGTWVERKTLAEQTNQSADSSAFTKRLTQLREQSLVEFGPNQTIRATLQWFQPAKAQASA
jgi:hypothetical protein